MIDPFEFLRRDLERISRAFGPRLLPTTVQISGRTFVIGYTSLKETPTEKGVYIAEVEAAEVGKGIVGGVTLALTPAAGVARIEWISTTVRGIGLGRAMVQAVEQDLASRGYERIDLLALLDPVAKTDTILFWKPLGYKLSGKGRAMFKLL